MIGQYVDVGRLLTSDVPGRAGQCEKRLVASSVVARGWDEICGARPAVHCALLENIWKFLISVGNLRRASKVGKKQN